MDHPLFFVVAPAAELPDGPVDWVDLSAAQNKGPQGAMALRLFPAPSQSTISLLSLPWNGQLPARPLCDALIPQFDPGINALGVYVRSAEEGPFQCLDRFSLTEASNETCWFYPTHDGTFFSWKRALKLRLAPGSVATDAQTVPPSQYARSQVTVLWSLMADDTSLTCVGLTYGGQRIEWPQSHHTPEPIATWSLITVDTQAEVTLKIDTSQTVVEESMADS